MMFKSVALNQTVANGLGVGENEKMADEIRDIGIFAAAGFLVAVLIIASVVAGGLRLPSLRLPSMVSNKGTLIIKIMDKPVELKHLNITIDWVQIKDQDENWLDLEMKSGAPFYFDLLALHNITETLSETVIPAGNYTMIRMHVLTANATYPDNSNATLRVPSDVIKVPLKPHIKMESDASVTVIIDLQPEDLKTIAISKSLNLRPVIRATVYGDY